MQPMTKLRLIDNELVSVKVLAAQYGISKSTLYELLRADPNFPFVNVGLKKKFMIAPAEFKSWLKERTEKQKEEHFNLPKADDLLKRFKK